MHLYTQWIRSLHCMALLETSSAVSTNLPELVMGIPRRQHKNECDEQDELMMKKTFFKQQVNDYDNDANFGAMMMISGAGKLL